MRLALSRAQLITDDVCSDLARFSGKDGTLDWVVGRALSSPRSHPERLALAANLHDLASSVSEDSARRAIGTASLIAGNFDLAVRSFGRIEVRTASDWNNLAAASICTARPDRPEVWLAALAAVDMALQLDADHIEARFNRARIVESLGIVPLARTHWTAYVALDSGSRWSAIARQRMRSQSRSDSDEWKAATATLERLSDAELADLANRYPQAARRYADAVYLSQWAAAMSSGDSPKAETELARVRVFGRTLRRRGDPFISDAVSSIDLARTDDSRMRMLIEGQLRYQSGRLALRDGDAVAAETDFRQAERLLRGRSPMATVVEFWIASALTEQQRGDDARRILLSLLARSEQRMNRYPSLTGHVQYQLSLLESWRGNWSASLAAASAARTAFALLGERGNLGNANAMLSENYDLLGQPEVSWKHGLAAIRESAADGALDRTRVALAALCRTELRGQRWDRARSLARLESELAPLAPDLRLEPDMFIRRAAAEWHLGAKSEVWLRRARESAERIRDPSLAAKLLADVDAAEGTFMRRDDPRRAVQLLTAAITFQQQVSRPIVLPELYLQRGRAHLARNELDAAESDFEAGLVELERQRTRISDAELRPGIFENAAELFDEAAALQVRRGASAGRIFSFVERGRARSLFEQVHAPDEAFTAPHPPPIEDIQRALPTGTILIEYIVLPDRLVSIVVARDRAVMRTVAVSRESLRHAASTFIDQRGMGGDTLHEWLIAPLRDDLQGASAINVVADDTLQRIPFAALFDRANRTFLIQRHSIATSPSAGVFLTTLDRIKQLPERDASVLVFANPAIPRELDNLPSLGLAEGEAATIARKYPHADVFVGHAATAERFVRLGPERGIVHFAGHGIINEREPYTSALVCATNQTRAGRVTAREIARIPFHSTRAVVLAACSTMAGRNAAIEGVPSLSRAFIVAGVPAVIGTLWDIEDAHAVRITIPLHGYLAKGVEPSAALRGAQLDAIRQRLPPSEWSAFALMGSATANAQQ